jgi:hypothetical protein
MMFLGLLLGTARIPERALQRNLFVAMGSIGGSDVVTVFSVGAAAAAMKRYR